MPYRAVIFMLAAASWHAATAAEHRSTFPPYLTLDMFIAEFRGTPHPSVPGSGSPYVRHHAQGYLAGVVDISQGETWCLPTGVEPAKADDLVVADVAKLMPTLAKRPADSLPPYAGPLLLEQYAAKFPLAASCTFTPRLTGDVFIAQLVGEAARPGKSNWDQSPETTNKQRYAEGYIAGVIDATQGRSWCAPRRLKPMAVQSGVLTELDKAKARGRLPSNAAQFLLVLFNAKFPCPQL